MDGLRQSRFDTWRAYMMWLPVTRGRPAAPGRAWPAAGQPGSIEIPNGVARCIGFDEHPIAIEMADVGDYV
jgi:hypothetical protein